MIGDPKEIEIYKGYELRKVLGTVYVYRGNRYCAAKRTAEAARAWVDQEVDDERVGRSD